MGESSRFTHNPFWLRSLKVSFCACSSFGSFGSSCRLRGKLGATGSAVRCTMESFIGDSLLEVCSDFSTTLLKDSATLLAMSESCFATGFHLLWLRLWCCNRVVYVLFQLECKKYQEMAEFQWKSLLGKHFKKETDYKSGYVRWPHYVFRIMLCSWKYIYIP